MMMEITVCHFPSVTRTVYDPIYAVYGPNGCFWSRSRWYIKEHVHNHFDSHLQNTLNSFNNMSHRAASTGSSHSTSTIQEVTIREKSELSLQGVIDEKHSIQETSPIHQPSTTTAKDESDDKKKKKKKEPSVPIYKLFRFATKLDLLMIFIASICSLGIGALQPTIIVIFGQFIDTLTEAIQAGESLVSATHDVVLIFVYFGTATLVAAYIAQSFWIMTGENQTRRVRKKVILTTYESWSLILFFCYIPRFVSFMFIAFVAKIWAGLTKLKKVPSPLVSLPIHNSFKMGKFFVQSLLDVFPLILSPILQHL